MEKSSQGEVCLPLLSIPGNIEEEQTLQLQILDFGGQVCAVTLRTENIS